MDIEALVDLIMQDSENPKRLEKLDFFMLEPALKSELLVKIGDRYFNEAQLHDALYFYNLTRYRDKILKVGDAFIAQGDIEGLNTVYAGLGEEIPENELAKIEGVCIAKGDFNGFISVHGKRRIKTEIPLQVYLKIAAKCIVDGNYNGAVKAKSEAKQELSDDEIIIIGDKQDMLEDKINIYLKAGEEGKKRISLLRDDCIIAKNLEGVIYTSKALGDNATARFLEQLKAYNK